MSPQEAMSCSGRFFSVLGFFSLSNEGAVINSLVSGLQAAGRCEAERGRGRPQAPLALTPSCECLALWLFLSPGFLISATLLCTPTPAPRPAAHIGTGRNI